MASGRATYMELVIVLGIGSCQILSLESIFHLASFRIHLTVAALFVTKNRAWHENEIMANGGGGKKGARVTECSLGQ